MEARNDVRTQGKRGGSARPAVAGAVKVLLDGRMAFHSGIGTYVRGLCREFLARPDEVSLTVAVEPSLAERLRAEVGAVDTIDFPADIYTLREQLHGWRVCRSRAGRASVVHFPHYNVPWMLRSNSVVTIHDVTHFEYPDEFGRARVKVAFQLLRRAVRKAARVITVSDATRRALETFVPEAVGKTTVVWHGVQEPFAAQPQEERDRFRYRRGVGEFFLFVGSGRPHKNLTGMLESFRRARERLPAAELVLAGVEPAALNGLQGVRAIGTVSPDELAGWYNAAVALVMPSLSEGFGLPVLEAMACGTPVIASDIAPLREVAGDAALHVGAKDPDAVAAAMVRIAGDEDLRSGMRARGEERARGFTWAGAARQTLDVYAGVAAR